MTELDQVWSEMIGSATASAARSGNRVALDYLMLRATNDQIRNAGVAWLFDTATGIVAEHMRLRPHLTAESLEPNSFRHGNSNLVGRAMNFRLGVRCLTIEAGWTRTPADGIMRGGSLATARISHFGMPRETALLQLILAEPSPVWVDIDVREPIDSSYFERHFEVLIDA
ncbi:MAG: hypothetical protein JNL64_01250 [Blastocatellia bacterium]|nr:hypothetical protein [Blastocatellia bacterium]